MARRLEQLVIKEISGVDDPANSYPGWILMKARDAGVDPEEIAAELEHVLRAHSVLHEALAAGMDYLSDAPEDVQAAAKKLLSYMKEMEMEEDAKMQRVRRADGGEVVFSADASMEGMRQKVQAALEVMMPQGEGMPYCWVRDVSTDGQSALVETEGRCFVADVMRGEGEDFTIAPKEDWQEVEQVWVAKSVVPFQDLPLADEDAAWDGGGARKRIKEWAGGDDWTPSVLRKAFVWYDGDAPDVLGSYKLPIADVIDGELKAVPRGVFAAAAALGGARGGVAMPEDEVAAARTHLAKYYKKLDRTAPWDTEKWSDRARRMLGIGKRDRDDIGLSREEVELIFASRFAISKNCIVSDIQSFGRGTPSRV